MTEPAFSPDPLAELREQIRATTAAAARLAAEAAAARAASPERPIPPAGWASPENHKGNQQELQALVALVEALRDLVPDELKQLVRDVLRQLLLLARTLADRWLERMDAAATHPGDGAGRDDVQQIPIE